MGKTSHSVPLKIFISMLVFAAALYLAWAGYGFGQWLKHATS